MKKVNNRGSVLQIVLVTFLVIVFALMSSLFLIQEQTKIYKNTEMMMKQKNLEILLVEYYVKEMKKGLLLSENYDKEGYLINSYVDDMGDFLEITTHIHSKEMVYQFLVQIDTSDYHVLNFEYLEG